MIRPVVSALVFAALCIGVVDSAIALDLTEPQKQFLAQIEQRLEQARTNAKAASDAAGPADKKPGGSQAKLALTRAAQARGQIDTVEEALAKLPAEDPAVKTVAKSCAELKKSIADLEARLGAAPATSNAGEQRLSSQDEQKRKDAAFYVREVEGAANALDPVVAQVKSASDPNALDHRLLAQAMATIEKARSRRAFIDERLTALPENGAGVAAAKKEAATAFARVDAAEAVLKPIHEQLQRIVDPASNPTLDADVQRMQGLAGMFGDLGIFEVDPSRAATIVAARPAAGTELERVLASHAELLKQDTPASQRVRGVAEYLRERLTTFDAAVAERSKTLPGIVDQDLAAALRMTEEAVSERKPLFFGGGIPQAVEFATAKVELLAAIDPAQGERARAVLAKTKTAIAARELGLRDVIVAENPLPPDRYTGADKAAWTQRAIDAWKALEPGAQVLAVRFPSERWSRESMWQLQNTTWYFIDRSKLQAQLIVRHDDTTAVIRPVNLWIDHADGDAPSAIPLHSGPKETLQPGSFLLLDRVK